MGVGMVTGWRGLEWARWKFGLSSTGVGGLEWAGWKQGQGWVQVCGERCECEVHMVGGLDCRLAS